MYMTPETACLLTELADAAIIILLCLLAALSGFGMVMLWRMKKKQGWWE